MDVKSSLTTDRGTVRASTDFSYRSSHYSMQDINSDDFYEICRSSLKVCEKNISLMTRLRIHPENPMGSFASTHFDDQTKLRLSKLRENREELSPILQSVKLDPLSCMFLYIIRKKDLHILMPDFELHCCRQSLAAGSTHECYFGLARLLVFEGRFNQALDVLSSAIKLNEDLVYITWHTVISAKLANLNQVKQKKGGFLQSFICCAPVNSEVNIVERVNQLGDSIEKWWSLMELSIKGIGELESPQFFSAKIKEIDLYFGYLAWSEVLFRRNEWQVALDIVKELISNYGDRPEAYIKLWQHYYFIVKDYQDAEVVASEALLKVHSQDLYNYHVLFCIYSARSQFKQKKYKEALNFLLRKFVENPTYPIFIYYYGRFCVKSEDYSFNGAAIGALTESLRLCDNSKYGLIYYWLAKGYMLGRQYIDAYDSIKLALQYIENTHVHKISELNRWKSDIHESIQTIKTIEKLLLKNFDRQTYKHCKSLCQTVKELHKLTVDILLAKMLWKAGRIEEALNKLYAVSGISTVKMTAYFLLLRLLEDQKNYKCMRTVALEMLVKCKNPQVPSHIWVRANLIYARILVKNSKPGKAILVLKCLAKSLPPCPFVDIPYTKTLQRAETIQELTSAHSTAFKSMNAYTYSTYKNSFITPNQNIRDFSQKLLDEEAAPLPVSNRHSHVRKSMRTSTEKFLTPRRFSKLKSLDIKDLEEAKAPTLLGITLPNLLDFKGFSICSNIEFLYKISKISFNSRICLQDGVCAINDYIELLRFEKDLMYRETCKNKARKLKENLLKIIAEIE